MRDGNQVWGWGAGACGSIQVGNSPKLRGGGRGRGRRQRDCQDSGLQMGLRLLCSETGIPRREERPLGEDAHCSGCAGFGGDQDAQEAGEMVHLCIFLFTLSLMNTCELYPSRPNTENA